jgi:hypothetical protein
MSACDDELQRQKSETASRIFEVQALDIGALVPAWFAMICKELGSTLLVIVAISMSSSWGSRQYPDNGHAAGLGFGVCGPGSAIHEKSPALSGGARGSAFADPASSVSCRRS